MYFTYNYFPGAIGTGEVTINSNPSLPVSRLTSSIVNMFRRGRGRPPKNKVWNPETGKYDDAKPPGRQSGNSTSANDDLVWDMEGLSLSQNTNDTWDSEVMNEVVGAIGPRQNPYRNCTYNQRDVSGQYRHGYYDEESQQDYFEDPYEVKAEAPPPPPPPPPLPPPPPPPTPLNTTSTPPPTAHRV